MGFVSNFIYVFINRIRFELNYAVNKSAPNTRRPSKIPWSKPSTANQLTSDLASASPALENRPLIPRRRLRPSFSRRRIVSSINHRPFEVEGPPRTPCPEVLVCRRPVMIWWAAFDKWREILQGPSRDYPGSDFLSCRGIKRESFLRGFVGRYINVCGLAPRK